MTKRPAFGAEPNVVPMLGANLPVDAAIEALGIPFASSARTNGNDNQHAANENLRVQNLWDGIELYAQVFARLGKTWTAGVAQ